MKMALLVLLTFALQLLVEQEQKVLMACRVIDYIITRKSKEIKNVHQIVKRRVIGRGN
jgi:hypothetical protein